MKKRYIVIVHLLFWLTIVVIPTFFFGFGPFKWYPESYYFLVQNVFNAIVFYAAYIFMIPFIMKRKSLPRMVWLTLAFIFVLALLRFLVNPSVKEALGAFQKWPISTGRQVFYASFWTFMYALYSLVIYLAIDWFRERRLKYELIREKQQSEIDLLKSQVNPHFLMNTLNNLYSLVYQGSKKAPEAIIKLSDLMRYMLYETRTDLVSLEHEIKYLNSFIELQLLRFTNKELVDLQVSGDPAGKLIAPMILVPFVENAFKHGNKNLPGMGITIRIMIEDKHFSFYVENIKASKSLHKINESGIGLKNIQKRLELLYPDRHELDILEDIDSFKISLKLDL
jgi:hypothetical protein